MPNHYVIANWKMNVPPEGIDAYVSAIDNARGGPALVVAPPYTYLQRVASAFRNGAATAAQNCADHEKGAYTGEISPAMIRDTGATFVILGHSERRSIYTESDVLIARKLTLALSTGLTPVLCIGEDLRARDAGRASIVLADQIRAAGVPELEKAREVILAYEPVWAIGTGRNASGLMVAETIHHIRDSLGRFWPSRFGGATPILYGGSVTPENATELVTYGKIDGFLVGGASLDSKKFLAIHAAMGKAEGAEKSNA